MYCGKCGLKLPDEESIRLGVAQIDLKVPFAEVKRSA